MDSLSNMFTKAFTSLSVTELLVIVGVLIALYLVLRFLFGRKAP